MYRILIQYNIQGLISSWARIFFVRMEGRRLMGKSAEGRKKCDRKEGRFVNLSFIWKIGSYLYRFYAAGEIELYKYS